MELKRCPFCGGEADLVRDYGRYGYFVYTECSVCGSRSRTFSDGTNKRVDWDSMPVQRAQQAWNRRVGGSDGQPDS